MVVLESERLLFRPPQPDDLEDSCATDMDALFRAPFAALTREEAERSFANAMKPREGIGLLATIYKPEARYIGRCGLYPSRDDETNVPIPGEATLAFYLAPAYWNRGLATEAGRAFVRYGFETLGLTRIVAGAAVENLASNRVLVKSGLVHTHSGGEGANGGPRWHAYAIRNPAA